MKQWFLTLICIYATSSAEKNIDCDKKPAILNGNELRMLFSDQDTIIKILRLHNARLEQLMHNTEEINYAGVITQTTINKTVLNNSYDYLHLHNELIKDEVALMHQLTEELITIVREIVDNSRDQ